MALNYDDEDDREDRTIYIGNLSDKVTENIIYELFFQAGLY
jgi:RNA recognition motif-containing protein